VINIVYTKLIYEYKETKINRKIKNLIKYFSFFILKNKIKIKIWLMKGEVPN